MKKSIHIKNIIGIILLVFFAGIVLIVGYKVIVKADDVPGKLTSIPVAVNNLGYAGATLKDVQKVTYDKMKYGYMDDLMLAQMNNRDVYYEQKRMEEVRAVNDLTAMDEKTMDKLAFQKAQEEQEEYKKRARAAALAVEEAKEEQKRRIAQRLKNETENINIIPIDTGDSSNMGFGDTASRGGRTASPVMATIKGKKLGNFVVTAYCTCRICCGVYSGGNRTASGTVPTANRTIAVDTNVIPFGTKVIINGQVYVAEDRGGAIKGNRIDMFFMTHNEALQWGRRTMEVYLAE